MKRWRLIVAALGVVVLVAVALGILWFGWDWKALIGWRALVDYIDPKNATQRKDAVQVYVLMVAGVVAAITAVVGFANLWFTRRKMDGDTKKRLKDWPERISSFGVEAKLDQGCRLELATYLWNEYQYRHDLVWRLVFRLTAAVVVLGIIPYTQGKVIDQIGMWIIVSPIFGVALAFIWSRRLKSELIHLDHIRGLYKPLQDSLFYKAHKGTERAFSIEILSYLGAVTVFAAFNVVFSLWIVAGKPWFC
jgi:putative effector of murein hydrolase